MSSTLPSATISLMKAIIKSSIGLARSSTAKDTSVLFLGNVLTAFLGFLLLLVLARAITVEEMGVFSAFTNLMFILGALSDPGISSGIVKFVAETRARKEYVEEKQYISAAFKVQLLIFAVVATFITVFSKTVATSLLATSETALVYILAIGVFAQIIWLFASSILKARRKFLSATIADSIVAALRLTIVLILSAMLILGLITAVSAYVFATIIGGIAGFIILKNTFINIPVERRHYTSLLQFSGWLGVNKISSVVAGKIDIQMIALLAGAVSTGIYSIPSRLVFFVTILVASLSSVIAPRLPAFDNKKREKAYLFKVLLFSLLIIAGLLVWYVIATPFILVLFGEKYIDSVPIFRLLIISIIPFVLTTPSVNAIIYSIKKPKFIGYFSIFQLIAVILLNIIFIPRFGAIGATYTLIITNTLLAIYTWAIVIRHYSKV